MKSSIAEIIRFRVWQSGCPVSFDSVKEKGINVIVNVGQEKQPWITEWEEHLFCTLKPGSQVRQGINLEVPLMDAPGFLDPLAFDTVVTSVLMLLKDPERRVLVHCEAGVYRSVYVSAAIYSAFFRVIPTAALERVDILRGNSRHPRTHLGFHDWDDHQLNWWSEQRNHYMDSLDRKVKILSSYEILLSQKKENKV